MRAASTAWNWRAGDGFGLSVPHSSERHSTTCAPIGLSEAESQESQDESDGNAGAVRCAWVTCMIVRVPGNRRRGNSGGAPSITQTTGAHRPTVVADVLLAANAGHRRNRKVAVNLGRRSVTTDCRNPLACIVLPATGFHSSPNVSTNVQNVAIVRYVKLCLCIGQCFLSGHGHGSGTQRC